MAAVLTVKILGESRSAVNAIDHVEGKLGRLSGVASGVGRAVLGAAAAAGAGVVAAGAFAVTSIKSASDLAETVSKSNVIFGEQAAAQMRGLADGAASALGLSERAYLDYASGYGNMLVSIGGLSQEAAAKQSADLVTLTSDIASFNNATNDEVFAAVNSALTGEFEPLKKYGVVINDATLKAKALELGLYKGTGAMSAQAKQAATLELVMEQTATAQGDFARTSDGAANQSKILGAQFENLKTDLGQKLLPVAVAALGFINDIFPKIAAVAGPALDTVIGAVRALIAAFKFNDGDITSSGLAGQMERIGYAARQLFEQVREVWPRIRQTIQTAAGIIGNVVGAIISRFREMWPQIKEAFGTVRTYIGSAIAGIVLAFRTLAPHVQTAATAVMGFVGFLRDNPEYLLAFAAGIAVVLVPAVIAWTVSTVAAAAAHIALAAATVLAYLPIIAIVAAVAALAAGLIWAYQNVDWFREAVDAVAGFLTGTLWPALKSVASFITGTVIPAIGNVIGWFVEMGGKAAGLATDIYDMVESVVGFIVGMPERISSAASGMFDGIKEAFRSAINWVIGKWNGLEFSIGGGSIFGQEFPSVTLGTPDIPKLHSGGVVPGRYGEEVFALLQAGETVRTREQEAALGGGIRIEHFHAADRPLLEEFEELQARYGVLV